MKKRADGRYQRSITINGKRHSFYGTSPSEVNKKILAFEEKKADGRYFKVVAEEWYDDIVPTLSPTTLRGYKPAKEDAVSEFGETLIKEIVPQDIQRYISRFARQRYAHKTVTTKLQIIHQIFDFAILNGDIQYNPCSAVKVPRNLPREERQAASPDDIQKIKQSDNLLALMALYTGCRRGELLALTISDFDFENDVINITKSVYFQNNKPYLKRPKTRSGTRTIPLLAPLKEKLLREKIKGNIFNNGGEYLTDKQARNMWDDFCEQSGVSCTLHQLRHAYATRLYELDVDVKSAQGLMGHADVHTTQEIYTHLTELKNRQTADKLKNF